MTPALLSPFSTTYLSYLGSQILSLICQDAKQISPVGCNQSVADLILNHQIENKAPRVINVISL